MNHSCNIYPLTFLGQILRLNTWNNMLKKLLSSRTINPCCLSLFMSIELCSSRCWVQFLVLCSVAQIFIECCGSTWSWVLFLAWPYCRRFPQRKWNATRFLPIVKFLRYWSNKTTTELSRVELFDFVNHRFCYFQLKFVYISIYSYYMLQSEYWNDGCDRYDVTRRCKWPILKKVKVPW